MFRLFYSYGFFVMILLNIHICLPQLLDYSEEGEPAFVPRVVNGWAAKHGDVPYQLAFKTLRSRARKTYNTFCGGTIIGPNKVLSAAHCFEDKKRSGCQKCFGASDVNKKKLQKTFAVAGNLQNLAKIQTQDSMEHGQWRRLKSMTIASRYKFPRNDICVGFTTLPFEFNSNVAMLPYATQYRDYVGTCLASGYGRISPKKGSDKLLLAHLEIISTTRCSRIHRRNMRKFVCTSSRVSDVHKGDSGGPLVCTGTGDPAEKGRGLLIGVVSGSRRRAGSFFTRVSSFRRFVDRAKGRALGGVVKKEATEAHFNSFITLVPNSQAIVSIEAVNKECWYRLSK